MPYAVDFNLVLGVANSGRTLTATIETMAGAPVVSGVGGWTEDPAGSGIYWGSYVPFADGTSYRLFFFAGPTLLATTSVSPSDASIVLAVAPMPLAPPAAGVSGVLRWFNKVAAVYVETDDFQVAVKTDLSCGLFHYAIDGSATGSDRAELMAARLLLWDPAYEMPEGSQVEIEGVRWQTPRGGYALIMRRASDTPAYRRAHVLRAV